MEELKHKFWIDTRLNKESMLYLNQAISESEKNSKEIINRQWIVSKLLKDKDDWFFETILKGLTERLFLSDWNNYYKYHIEKEELIPKFVMDRFWVNYQYQHEFNPLHDHGGLFTFVIFIKIPTHWKEQHNKNKDIFRAKCASDFVFVWSEKGQSNSLLKQHIHLSPEDEGRILFFPTWLQHLVYPFYDTEEERITISGNIGLYDPDRPGAFKYNNKERETIIKMMENNIKMLKAEQELEQTEQQN